MSFRPISETSFPHFPMPHFTLSAHAGLVPLRLLMRGGEYAGNCSQGVFKLRVSTRLPVIGLALSTAINSSCSCR